MWEKSCIFSPLQHQRREPCQIHAWQDHFHPQVYADPPPVWRKPSRSMGIKMNTGIFFKKPPNSGMCSGIIPKLGLFIRNSSTKQLHWWLRKHETQSICTCKAGLFIQPGLGAMETELGSVCFPLDLSAQIWTNQSVRTGSRCFQKKADHITGFSFFWFKASSLLNSRCHLPQFSFNCEE